MTNLKLLLICHVIWFLPLTTGTDAIFNSSLWPDLSCHDGYLKDGSPNDENGEEFIIWSMHDCVDDIKNKPRGDLSPDCFKRCMLERVEVLAWLKFEFNSEDEMAEALERYLFKYTPQSAKKIAKQILESDCQPLLTALANAEIKPSCEDQDEFINCVEKAMQCK